MPHRPKRNPFAKAAESAQSEPSKDAPNPVLKRRKSRKRKR